jgi:precorrin-6Y C5,15-methyltransferase (decarboxylating)
VSVLASGDPFHFGVGKQLARRFPVDEMLCLPHPSAFSLAAARLGWALQDVALVSLHGRPLAGIVRHLSNGARILALADGAMPARLASLLIARGMPRSRLTVLERMGGPHERFRTALANDFALRDVGPLTTLAVEVVADRAAPVVGLASGLDDALFEHDGQMTKRALSWRAVVGRGPGRRIRGHRVAAAPSVAARHWRRGAPRPSGTRGPQRGGAGRDAA